MVAIKPDFAEKTRFKTAPKSIKLNDLLKVESKKEEAVGEVSTSKANIPFTNEALLEVWKAFAETRKMHQADYFLLNQPYERVENKVIIPLSNALQETMLGEFKLELINFLRERLHNTFISVVGELREVEDKKMIYTPRDKFDYLVAKNPLIKELKDRLGLDPDY